MTVRQLLACTSSAELTEWMAFDAIEPIGQRRGDYQAATIAACVVNHSMSPPKKPVSLADMLLRFRWEAPPSDTPQGLAARIRALLNSKAGG